MRDGRGRSAPPQGAERFRTGRLQAFIQTRMWMDWINGLLGLGVIGVAFLGLTGATLGWTLGILGAVIAILGFWSANAGAVPTVKTA
jgi:hypothetical protein